MSAAIGVYIHWPYCQRVCPYCDFNVVRDRRQTAEQTALGEAILADLRAHAGLLGGRELASVYFGGGTPSLMHPALAGRIIETCIGLWRPVGDLEVTLEANPTDAEAARFRAFAAAGVNRLSLGLQSLDDVSLKFLGRNHDTVGGRRAAEAARAAFPRVSLDLIYALPGQSSQAWSAELSAAAALGAEHISAYQLTIEPGVAFERLMRRGRLIPPSPELAADLFETTEAVLGAAGYAAYEISNHARGAEAWSRHNLIYWRGGEYLGVGPGAHGRLNLDGCRRATFAPRSTAAYIARLDDAVSGSDCERLSDVEVAQERLVMGLRTAEGVAVADLNPLRIDSDAVGFLIREGLVHMNAARVSITARGRPLTDRITWELANGAAP